MTMNRRASYQPKHALRCAHLGTHVLTYRRRPNWVAVWMTVTIAAIILTLAAFVLAVVP